MPERSVRADAASSRTGRRLLRQPPPQAPSDAQAFVARGYRAVREVVTLTLWVRQVLSRTASRNIDVAPKYSPVLMM